MFSTRVRLASLIFTSLITGCTSDEPRAWTAPGGSGKADGISIIDGSEIPSQFVDPQRHYVAARYLHSLVELHALSDAALAAAQRADAMSAGTPNGRLEAGELVALEAPAVFSTLTHDERNALPALWSLLEVPDVAAEVGSLELAVEDRSIPHVSKVAAVPEPGRHASTFARGGITLTYVDDVEIKESRMWEPGVLGRWSAEPWLVNRPHATLGNTAGGSILVRELSTTDEYILDDEQNVWSSDIEGDFVLERFENGELQERHHLVGRTSPHARALAIFDMADFSIELADGTPLVKNVVSTQRGAVSAQVDFRYERAVHPNLAADEGALDLVATPISSLSAGRYTVALPDRTTYELELYPTGVVTLAGARMRPTERDNMRSFYVWDPAGRHYVWFNPSTNRLHVEADDSHARAVVADIDVTPTMHTN